MQGSARKDVVCGAARVYTVVLPGPKWKSWLKKVDQRFEKIDSKFAAQTKELKAYTDERTKELKAHTQQEIAELARMVKEGFDSVQQQLARISNLELLREHGTPSLHVNATTLPRKAGHDGIEGFPWPVLVVQSARLAAAQPIGSHTPPTLLPQRPDFLPERDGPNHPAQAAPRSCAACHRTAAGSDAPPPGAASNSACWINRPPVFTNCCCKLVSDQLLILWGSPSRRHRLPRL